MGNPIRGEASFRVGGQTWTLVFDVNAFCELEADTRLGIIEIIDQIQDRPSFTLMRSVYCAGLQKKHPGTTKEEAGDLISDGGEAAGKALQKALKQAMPEPKLGGDENPPAGEGGTG